tara:strand:- start:1826 stop:2893 length:1068 start_codon:yes stop_codon:yes gene_type:complete
MAFSFEDLENTFIEDSTYRALSIQELEAIEAGLFELGLQEKWNHLEENLGLTEKLAISQYIRTCELELDVQGTYQRGQTRTYQQGLVYGLDLSRPELIFDRPDILEQMENSYQWYAENNEVYISLVIQEWPILCIRPGMKFGRVLSVFVHELEHYLGDNNKVYTLDDLSDPSDFADLELRRSGGEYNAFIEGSKILIQLENQYNWNSYDPILNFFSSSGELVDEEGFVLHILFDLSYMDRFRNNYQTKLNDYQNDLSHDRNFLQNLVNTYTQNRDISQYNITVSEDNIRILERNKSIFRRNNQIAQLRAAETSLEHNRRQLVINRESLEFYSNLLIQLEQMLNERSQNFPELHQD